MGDLTRFQHQVLNAARMKEHEEKEKKREEARQQAGGGGPTRNSRAGGGGSAGSSGSDMGQEETVRYVNREENPDHEVH